MAKIISTELISSYDHGDDRRKGFGISWVKQYEPNEFIFPIGWGTLWFTVDGISKLDNEGLNKESVLEVLLHFAENTGFDKVSMQLLLQHFVETVSFENS